MSNYTIRSAHLGDEQAINVLLPRLKDFAVPEHRNPDDLWRGDAELLLKALKGDAPDSHVIVAVDTEDKPVGVSLYTIKPELLSGAVSVHLEALAIAENHQRQGLAQRLIETTGVQAKEKGATCMSLHVFSNNERARALYKHCNFDEELIRCYKPLV